jgi:hypothetical protein
MPRMKYFGFVGSALVLLLLAMNWLLPGPNAEPVHGGIERPVIRISSIETLPERVVFDTSMSHMAPPSSVTRVAVQPPQSAFTFEQITPGVLPTFSTVAQVAPKKSNAAKRDPAKMVATHRAVSQVHTAAAKNYVVREDEPNAKPPIKTTFLDDIAGRFGQMFKVN